MKSVVSAIILLHLACVIRADAVQNLRQLDGHLSDSFDERLGDKGSKQMKSSGGSVDYAAPTGKSKSKVNKKSTSGKSKKSTSGKKVKKSKQHEHKEKGSKLKKFSTKGTKGSKKGMAKKGATCDVTGTYSVTEGYCDFGPDNTNFPDGLLHITSERNTIALREGAPQDFSWITNNVTVPFDAVDTGAPLEFQEDENCALDHFANGPGPVYDCLTIARVDMDRPNVILRYSWNAGCDEFWKMVQVLPGDEPGVVPHICNIHSVKVDD